MTKKNKHRISIFADEFDHDVWESYCEIAGAPLSAESMTIWFNRKDVEYQEAEGYWDDEEDEEDD